MFRRIVVVALLACAAHAVDDVCQSGELCATDHDMSSDTTTTGGASASDAVAAETAAPDAVADAAASTAAAAAPDEAEDAAVAPAFKPALSPVVVLNDGGRIPAVGLGVYEADDGPEAYNAILHALKSGYRHIDTAALYGNEVSVGKAVRDSGVPREEVWITTKLWAPEAAESSDPYKYTIADATERTEKLGTYIDLYLTHSPHGGAKTRAAIWRAMQVGGCGGRASFENLICSCSVGCFSWMCCARAFFSLACLARC